MAENKIKTIGVLTSGGDAPGMNAAIRAVVRRGLSNGLNVKGILKGYNGLLNEEIIDMSAKDVSDTIERGGTILYTARCAELEIERAILCCKSYHARRCLMYYQLLYPKTEFYVVPVNADGITRENWRKNEEGIDAVTGELSRIVKQFSLMLER